MLVPLALFKDNFFGNVRDGQTTYSVLRAFDAWGQSDATYIESQQLVWVEEQSVEPTLKFNAEVRGNTLDRFLDDLTKQWTSSEYSTTQEQVVLSGTHAERDTPAYHIHHRTETAALLSVDPDKALIIDTLLPVYWKSTILPSRPISYIPVPTSSIEHIKEVLSNLKFNPEIASVVNNISVAQIKYDIEFLTGEDGKSGIVSRHAFSTGALVAAEWLKERFEETGATCKLRPFLTGFSPNVVCRYSAVKETTATVVLGAHYDSRGSFGDTRAPGADDDGSGTTALLAIARTIARKHVQFHSNVELVAFSGEEQGLLGSRAYAQASRSAGANITLMVQADMLAYRAPGEPLQIGFPDRIGTSEAKELVANISLIYTPEVQVGFTSACCSDHQSFHEQGFPATQVFERAGPIADPMYHNSGDLSRREGYDFKQLHAIAKVEFATLLHTAGFEISS